MANKWHQYVGIRAALIVATCALLGGLAGYFGAYVQTKTSRRTSLDELALSLVEFELTQRERLGLPSDYSTISHWAVIRNLLDRYEELERVSLEDLRDDLEVNYRNTCFNHRAQAMIALDLWRLGFKDKHAVNQFLIELDEDIKKMRKFAETADGGTESEALMYANSWARRAEVLKSVLDPNFTAAMMDLRNLYETENDGENNSKPPVAPPQSEPNATGRNVQLELFFPTSTGSGLP